MKKFCFVVFISVAFIANAEEHAYLYPAILRSLPNLAENSLSRWKAGSVPGYEMLRVKGTPFCRDGEALFVRSQVTSPNYWTCEFKLAAGHRYLAGVWVKNDNAKILVSFLGRGGNPPETFDQRIYYFSGFNKFLEPYLSEKIKKLLSNDSSNWKLLYRQIDVPSGVQVYTVKMHVGIYFTSGAITIADPFILDITDNKDHQLLIDIESETPVTAVHVFEQGNLDNIMVEKFDPPVKSLKKEVPRSYFTRGFDRDEIEGYSMLIEYSDGRNSSFCAPQKKIIQNR